MRAGCFRVALLSTLIVASLILPTVSTISLLSVSPVSASPDQAEIIVRGKGTAFNITQTGDPPWYEYEVGDRPVVMAAKKIESGGVVAAGIVPTCRTSPTPGWTNPDNPFQYLDILFDEAFRWMVSEPVDVLWYEGYNVYNTASLCSELVDALELAGYTVTPDATMPITSSLLSAYDILVLPQLQLGTAGTGGDPDLLPDADVQAIKSFVEDGGGLFIMDGSDFGGHHFSKVMNKILESLDFGYFFQDDQVSDTTNNWAESDYRPIVDVDTTTDIGSAYETATVETEIGLYSVCSLAEAGPGVSLFVLPDYQTSMPGATIEYIITVSNPENPLAIDLTYDLTLEESADWSPDIHPTSVSVQVGESGEALLIVTIPDDVSMGTEDTIVVTATARGYPEVQTSFTTVACAGLRIEPFDDVYVSDQDVDANYSGENALRIGRYYEYWQWPFLKFDLSEIPSDVNITDARLYLYAYYKYASGFDVLCYEVDDDDWMELDITWSNKPEYGTLLNTKPVDYTSYDSPKSYSWDVTSFVVSEFEGDQWASFCLRPPETLPESTSRAFWSKEHYEGRVHPFLRISYPTEVVPFSVSMSPKSQSGSPGETLTYTATVLNESGAQDTYDLTVTDPLAWGATVSPTSLTIATGASDTTTLTVTIPSGAATNTIKVTASSRADPALSASDTCTAIPEVGEVDVSVTPSSKSDSPGSTLTYTVTVANQGDAEDTYDLTVTDPLAWGATVSPTSLTIGAGSSGTATVSVTIPDGTADGTEDEITVRATSRTNSAISDSASCTAQATAPTEEEGLPMTLIAIVVIVVVIVVVVALVLLRGRKAAPSWGG